MSVAWRPGSRAELTDVQGSGEEQPQKPVPGFWEGQLLLAWRCSWAAVSPGPQVSDCCSDGGNSNTFVHGAKHTGSTPPPSVWPVKKDQLVL